MTEDNVDKPVQSGISREDEELTIQRWQRELEEMTPEERGRVTASLSASFDKLKMALDLRTSIPSMTAFSTKRLFAEVDFSGFDKIHAQINAWVLEQSGALQVMKSIDAAVLRCFPANLRSLPKGKLEHVNVIIRDDGIALYGAPPGKRSC